MFTKAQVPMLRILLPFVTGILLAIYFNFYEWYFFVTGLALFFLFLIISYKKIFNRYKQNWINGILIHLLFIFFGYLYTINRTSFNNSDYIAKINIHEQGLVLGEVEELPTIRTHSTKVLLEVVGIRNAKEWRSASGKVVLYIKTDSLCRKIEPGSRISFLPKFEDVPAPKNPNEFDYRQYMAFHLVQKQVFLQTNEWVLIPSNNSSILKKYAGNLRRKLIQIYSEYGLKDKELAVASALVLGYKDEIDSKLKRAYSSSGAMHVLAVSGLHVGIIFLIVTKLLYFLEKKKYGSYIKLFLLIGILWFYALLTGLSPSVLRAATMFSFVAIANVTNRNSSFFNTLASSAFFLLIVNPFIIMEVGFQLSYLAVIGIVIFYPWFYNIFSFKNLILNYVWSITSVSLAAQLVTFPLSLLYFHQFPNYFLLSNLIVIPIATLILPAGILLFILSPFKIAATYLAIGLKYTLQFLNDFVIYVETLPNALLQNIPFSVFETWMLYCFLFFLICFGWYKRYAYIFSALCCIIFSLSYRAFLSDSYKNHSKFIVYNIPKHTAVNFIHNSNNVLITDLDLHKNREKMLFHVQNNWINHGLNNENVIYTGKLEKKYQLTNIFKLLETGVYTNGSFIGFKGKKIYVLNKNLPYVIPDKPIPIDYLIITGKGKMDFSRLKKYFTFKKIILDSSVSSGKAEYIKNTLFDLPVYEVKKQGYFIADV